MIENTKSVEQVIADAAVDLTNVEAHDVIDQTAQRSPVIFEIIRRSGEEELGRPKFSLWSSGLAAGLSMGMSVLAQALLREHLPKAEWSMLIEKLGYPVGFVLVILAHQQLFTENTLTAVIPIIADFTKKNIKKMLRLWSIVLSANLTGTFIFALFIHSSSAVSPAIKQNILEISLESLTHPFMELLTKGIAAGFLVATLVWILANVENSKLTLIILLTYLIALGNFSHIVAGSVEASYLMIANGLSLTKAVSAFYIPTFIGNVTGGSALVAFLAYGQIYHERKAS